MTETLSSIFQRTLGAPIEVAEGTAHPIFQKKLRAGKSRFSVQRLKSSKQLVPGLRLKVVNGEIEVNGQRHTEMILWADTSPESVFFTVVSKKACELKVWNVWRVNDMVQAWVGNAGILITEEGGITILECSGGTEIVDFSTLVYKIESID